MERLRQVPGIAILNPVLHKPTYTSPFPFPRKGDDKFRTVCRWSLSEFHTGGSGLDSSPMAFLTRPPVLMADDDWRTQLSASDRYENIQKIKSVLEATSPDAKATSQSDAFSVENQAYKDSSSRAQYDEICQLVGSANLSRPEAPAPAADQPDDTGVTIGCYQNCLPFASGLTSEVYRCKDQALKVIVETHNIEPHNPHREAKILATLKQPCIPLLETFRDQEQRFVLVFPYKPMTLAHVIDKGTLPLPQVRRLFKDIFTALVDIHSQGIIHRDLKPEAILLDGPDGPAYLSDFGTAWHPTMSIVSEPAKSKILDIGTGPYRAPEALFGDKAYGPSVDMWAVGAMLAECCRNPPKPLFESRPAHEDGNQLGLILSIFKTLGTPTRETWPEASSFKTPPFEMYRKFDGQPWTEILPEVDPQVRDLISGLVRFDSKRATAEQNAPDTTVINDNSTGPRRQPGDPNRYGLPAISDATQRTAGGKTNHHCPRKKGHKGASRCWTCRDAVVSKGRKEKQQNQAGGLANKVLLVQPARIKKRTTQLRGRPLKRQSQLVWADRLRRAIPPVTIVKDAPEVIDPDADTDEVSVSDDAEAAMDEQEDAFGTIEPESVGVLSREEWRLWRIREAEEILQIVRAGLDRLI
ncbi:hypothetical protein CORC01_07344 [Colletotrichum orchidophilum]|uniref:cyclin-dependent kinase n=1 Tax=Colletotrichum orchidophilum TaxID=1209926 RepID=A0A1G4B762_9PEZI|nr:uncharacterized protein CORC01_07344 [Colletotrichum orchidophilum]OHE97289.1 hypothetical protein CORC01_07344 [Colletotrichum orchidophilum]